MTALLFIIDSAFSMGSWKMLLVLTIVASVAMGLYHWFMRIGTRYELTERRFKIRLGLVRVHTVRLELIDIQDVSFQQSLLERSLSIGNVMVIRIDTSHPVLELRGIANPDQVCEQISGAVRSERKRHRLHITD